MISTEPREGEAIPTSGIYKSFFIDFKRFLHSIKRLSTQGSKEQKCRNKVFKIKSMVDWIASLREWWDEKTSSPLYWTYACFLVVWNWKFFQIIFLEDAELLDYQRIRYIEELALQVTAVGPINGVLNLLWHIIPPALLTALAIKFLPKIHNWAFKIHAENISKRSLILQREIVSYEEEVAKLVKREAKAVEEKAQQIKVIKQTKTQEEKWTEELEQIKRGDLLQGFQKLVGIIYGSGGIARAYQIERGLVNNSSIMAFAGTLNLITAEEGGGSNTVTLTDKGKYFSRLLVNKGINV